MVAELQVDPQFHSFHWIRRCLQRVMTDDMFLTKQFGKGRHRERVMRRFGERRETWAANMATSGAWLGQRDASKGMRFCRQMQRIRLLLFLEARAALALQSNDAKELRD